MHELGWRLPLIHYGFIASGDTVMKFGEYRENDASREVIVFEMKEPEFWPIYLI
jgi:hypothetical protein